MNLNQGDLGPWNRGQQIYPTQQTDQAMSGYVTVSNQYNQRAEQDYLLFMQKLQENKAMLSGNKPIVVCGGEVKEAKDMDEAQVLAESLAHSKSADAYILKPVKKVAPKRDVVTTDLP